MRERLPGVSLIFGCLLVFLSTPAWAGVLALQSSVAGDSQVGAISLEIGGIICDGKLLMLPNEPVELLVNAWAPDESPFQGMLKVVSSWGDFLDSARETLVGNVCYVQVGTGPALTRLVGYGSPPASGFFIDVRIPSESGPGQVVATFSIPTSAERRVSLTFDKSSARADGTEVVVASAVVTDQAGQPIPDFPVEFRIGLVNVGQIMATSVTNQLGVAEQRFASTQPGVVLVQAIAGSTNTSVIPFTFVE